jgi:hypothetical protein
MLKMIERWALPLFAVLVCLSFFFNWLMPILLPYLFVSVLWWLWLPYYLSRVETKLRRKALLAPALFNVFAVIGTVFIWTHFPWCRQLLQKWVIDGLTVLLGVVVVLNVYLLRLMKYFSRPSRE